MLNSVSTLSVAVFKMVVAIISISVLMTSNSSKTAAVRARSQRRDRGLKSVLSSRVAAIISISALMTSKFF